MQEERQVTRVAECGPTVPLSNTHHESYVASWRVVRPPSSTQTAFPLGRRLAGYCCNIRHWFFRLGARQPSGPGLNHTSPSNDGLHVPRAGARPNCTNGFPTTRCFVQHGPRLSLRWDLGAPYKAVSPKNALVETRLLGDGSLRAASEVGDLGPTEIRALITASVWGCDQHIPPMFCKRKTEHEHRCHSLPVFFSRFSVTPSDRTRTKKRVWKGRTAGRAT